MSALLIPVNFILLSVNANGDKCPCLALFRSLFYITDAGQYHSSHIKIMWYRMLFDFPSGVTRV